MADYYVRQNYQGLKPGTVISLRDDEISEVLRRGIAGGLLVEEKPAKKAKPVEVVEEVAVDGSDSDTTAE